MSDLIIKGMNMPKNCLLCPCCVGEGTGMGRQHYCQAIDDEPYVSENHRPENCPIPEIPTPHGRLIDADKLMKVIKENDYMLRSCLNTVDRGMFTIGIKQAIDKSPTIIEAEQGDG